MTGRNKRITKLTKTPMTKKIALGLVALVAVAAGVAGLSAFEAHVINVTAKIENALQVSAEALDFGTVFPQEHLAKTVDVALSSSFLAEDRVDDVNYFIRQKPKCGLTNEDGTQLIGPTATGHVVVGDNPATPGVVEEYYIDCGPAPLDPTGQPLPGVWGVLPSLCEYISKEGDDDNDRTTPSFHTPWQVVDGVVRGLDTNGRLAKSENDTSDTWTIDLAVPCFGDHCAQDWADFVHGINPNVNPDDYVLNQNLEHKVFGCDLWIEVTNVSERSNSGVLSLENKTGDPDWNEIPDQTFGTLGYNLFGPTFDYDLNAQGLTPNTSYSLIYAPDPWPQATGTGENTRIAMGSTDGTGNLALSGSIDLGYDLPHPNDTNSGAKIWVVLSADHDGIKMIAWNPSAYLFEHELITYDDTDI